MVGVRADDGADLPSDNDVAKEIDKQTIAEDTSKTPKLGLFDIPQEIRDIIFDYAYPEVEDLKITTKPRWTHRQLRARMQDSSHVKQPFPVRKVDEFMVSKAFLEEAARAWIGNQWLDHIVPFAMAEDDDAGKNTLLCTHATRLIWQTSPTTNYFECFPVVKQIRFIFFAHEFVATSKFAWEVEYTDEDIRTTRAYRETICFSGLSSFETDVKRAEKYEGRKWSQAQLDVWRANVKKLEELVISEASRPRETKPDDKQEQEGLGDDCHDAEYEYSEEFVTNRLESLLRRQIRDRSEAAPVLHRDDIPDSDEDMIKMLARDPKKVLVWIYASKKQLHQGEAQQGDFQPTLIVLALLVWLCGFASFLMHLR